jgi:hypothetical protein
VLAALRAIVDSGVHWQDIQEFQTVIAGSEE